MLASQIQEKLPELSNLCHQHQVKKLFVFGSAVNGSFSKSSDVDLLIELDHQDPIVRGGILIDLWDRFEAVLNRKVDLLTPEVIQNPYLKSSIEETKVLIYDRSREKISV